MPSHDYEVHEGDWTFCEFFCRMVWFNFVKTVCFKSAVPCSSKVNLQFSPWSHATCLIVNRARIVYNYAVVTRLVIYITFIML
jgi:hypothetical protein